MTPAPFFYHPRMLAYDFGPEHPLKPERLRRTVALLEDCGWEPADPGPGDLAEPSLVHSPQYIEVVQALSAGICVEPAAQRSAGFGSVDNPPFLGMHEASLAYVAGSSAAARAVVGGARVAFGMAGGLHHARRGEASGFCVYNDCAVACSLLRQRFERVAYVDIDVHHGDGVQWIFYDDPTVLTSSIHQDGRTLYPGTGSVEETGAEGSAVNVPLLPGTTGDVWLWAFREGILPLLSRFQPEAIVLQLGCDSHESDPLARIRNTAQEWLAAVEDVLVLGLPIVALGGGGYDLHNVPRMWAAACRTLVGDRPGDDEAIPEPFASAWGVPAYFDEALPEPRDSGREFAEATVRTLHRLHAL